MKTHRQHRGYRAFLGHRVSGILLAAFLPVHFAVLGLALKGSAALDEFLVFAENPLVKFAEWGLVILLSLHLFFGARLMLIELCQWPTRQSARLEWIVPCVIAAFVVGIAFIAGAF